MLISNRLSSHVLLLCIIAYVPFILHVMSLLHNLWHHSNAYISFMHYSDRNAGERDRWARQVRWTRVRCRVPCWARRKPRQEAKHDPLYLFKLMQFFYLMWVLLGYIYSILCIAFLYLLLCIYLPLIIYPCSCHLLVNELLNLLRCLAMLRVSCHLIGKYGQESSHLSGYPCSHLFGLSHVGLEE